MRERRTAAEFSSREQGYSHSPITRVALPFPLSRPPRKRSRMCTLGHEDMGYWVDVDLDLAPPVRGRHWWSVWAFAHVMTWDGEKNHHAGQPVGFLGSADDDQEGDAALYLLMKVVDRCCLGCEEIHSGMLDEFQVRAAILASDKWSGDSRICESLNGRQCEKIVAHALPDMREVVSERLAQVKQKKQA